MTVAATFLLLFAGGLVTSTGSGLAVPDWPLANGEFFPEMTGGVLFEHGHRMVAAGVGFLTVVLATWIIVSGATTALRLLALGAALTVVFQGILGGITVIYKLPTAVSVMHACLAQIFLCLVVTIAVLTGRGWASRAGFAAERSVRGLGLATAIVVFGQLLAGALMRHSGAGLAIPDFPLAFGRLIPPLTEPLVQIHFAHRVGAVLVLIVVLATVWQALGRARGAAWLRRPALLLSGLTMLQLALGASVIWLRKPVVPTTVHLVNGAAVLACAVLLALRASRAREGR